MNHARDEGHDVGAKPKDGVWWIYPKDGRTPRVKDENGQKRSKTDLQYRKTKTVGSGYFYI
jgi:hypothetical protein